ncbi:MAG: PAS domain S-box protein [Planctomycetes bacterium]|nr:PAS domain S-box protein [Planctomycetota bacterium]
MNPTDNISDQLISEIASLRKQIGDLEKTEKDRNKMVETLKKERDFSSAVIETVGALVVVFDRQGRIVSFNKACENITGYALKEVFSKCIWDVFIIPEEVKQIRDIFGKLVGTKLPNSFENYWITKDGNRRLIAWSNSVLLDDNNSVEFIIGTGIDITERREALESIRASEKFLSDIFSSIKDGISILDNDLNIIRVNPTMERWYTHVMPLVGKKCYEAYHGRKYPCEICPSQQTIKTGKPAYEVVPKAGKDYNQIGWLGLYSHPFVDTKTNRQTGVIEYVHDISKERRSEELIRESEEKYRTIIENSYDMIWTFDTNGSFTFLNQQTMAITGHKMEDVQGKSFAPYIYAEDLEIAKEAFQNTMAGKPQQNTMRIYKADGTLFTMLFTLAPVYKEGVIVGGVGFGVDIGTRKLMEEALHESEKRYRTLTEAAHDMIFIVGRDFRVQYANGFGAKQFDAQPSDIVGKLLAELFPATADRMQKNILQVFDTNKPLCVSSKTPYPKRELWIETWLAPIMDSTNNKVTSVMGIARDITLMKKQDEEIIRSKQTLENILEGISDSIFLLSRDLRIIWANNAALKETGCSRKELIGSFCYKVTHNSNTPCQAPLDICPVSEMVRTNKPVVKKHTHFDKLGHKKIIEVTAYPIKDSNGEITQFVHIGKDITSYK